MAWTAASIIPSVGSVVNRAPNPARNQMRTQVGSSVPVPTGSTNLTGLPAFLNNAGSAFLGNQMYSDLISQILQSQSGGGAPIPPELAQAYANQANANTERLKLQNAATQAIQALPGQLAESRARESALAPWSLSGLPTGLGYRDPLSLTTQRANTFDLSSRLLAAPSGWMSPPGFF